MMLTRRSVTVGSAAVATTALALGPGAVAAPPHRRRGPPLSIEGGQAVLDWEQISIDTVYPGPLRHGPRSRPSRSAPRSSGSSPSAMYHAG